MKSNRNYLVGMSKLKWSEMCKDYGGYITPSETKALVDKGCIPCHDWMVGWQMKKLKEGDSRPSWVYFSKIV